MNKNPNKITTRINRRIRENLPPLILLFLILLFFIIYFWNSIFISIKSGQAGVLYMRFAGGTVTDRVYDEGIHIIAPWDKMTIYNVRFQTRPHQMDVLTKRGLTLKLTLSIRYHPEYDILGVLHQTVGTDYVNKIVLPEVEAALRRIIGQFEPEEVYTTKRAVIQKILTEALEQTSRRFVEIDDVMITRIELPEAIKEAIQTKLVQQQLARSYEFKLAKEKKEAERKRIEAAGIKDYNNIVDSSLTEDILRFKGVNATKEIAASENAKVIIIGAGRDGLPIILNTEDIKK